LWQYRYSDEIYHGDHKYIAKIGSGPNAKYFYTQEALNAYKQALSSKDEKAAMVKAENHPDVQKIDGGYMTTNKEAGKRLEETSIDYYESKKLKGKLKDVAEVHKEIKAEKETVKAEKKQQRKQKLDVYKKALSSEDEKAALDKAVKEQNAKAKDLGSVNKSDAKNVVKAVKSKNKEAVKKELSEITSKGKQQQMNEAAAKTKAAEKAYAESQTVKGKAKAVADTYKKLNPKSAERIQNGKNYLDELLKKRR
jgi:hypothetical protein